MYEESFEDKGRLPEDFKRPRMNWGDEVVLRLLFSENPFIRLTDVRELKRATMTNMLVRRIGQETLLRTDGKTPDAQKGVLRTRGSSAF